MNTETGCVRRTDPIFVVTGVDKTLTRTAAFEGWVTHPDTHPEDLNVGLVLARIRRHDRRWQAGRTAIDGARWEERTWPQDEFIAFRDHVADLVETKLSRQERLEEMAANCGINIRNWRRMQARHDPSSEDYDHLEGLIAETRKRAASIREELKALEAAPPEMAAAR